jgi:hypothetical protein
MTSYAVTWSVGYPNALIAWLLGLTLTVLVISWFTCPYPGPLDRSDLDPSPRAEGRQDPGAQGPTTWDRRATAYWRRLFRV